MSLNYKQQAEAFKQALKWIIRVDQTKPYKYDEPDPSGRLPTDFPDNEFPEEKGFVKFQTPKEIAETTMKYVKAGFYYVDGKKGETIIKGRYLK